MRRNQVLTVVAALTFGAVTAFAQAKPNFAGSWKLVPDSGAAQAGAAAGARGGRGGRGGGGLGQAFTITQDEKTLTVTRTGPNGDIKTVYNLDGSPSKNSMTMGQNTIDQTATAKWDGSKLTVSTSMDMQGTTRTTTQSFSVDASGNLVIESEQPGRNGGAATTTKTTYKKG